MPATDMFIRYCLSCLEKDTYNHASDENYPRSAEHRRHMWFLASVIRVAACAICVVASPLKFSFTTSATARLYSLDLSKDYQLPMPDKASGDNKKKSNKRQRTFSFLAEWASQRYQSLGSPLQGKALSMPEEAATCPDISPQKA